MAFLTDDPTNSRTGNKYKYSFSGADARVFAWFPQVPSQLQALESVHTLSISIHEAKGPARALGFRGVKGYARGVRTIAGSLIMTVVNDHPLLPLHEQYVHNFVNPGRSPEPPQGWSLDRHRSGVGGLFNNYSYNNRIATLLPPFNLAMQFVSETGPEFLSYNSADPVLAQLSENPEGAGLMLTGVEFIDAGLVTSVQDIVTEMTFSFVACDYKPLSGFDTQAGVPPSQFEYAENEHLSLARDLFSS